MNVRAFIYLGLFCGFLFLSTQSYSAENITGRDPTRPEVFDVVAKKGSKKEVRSYQLQSIIISPIRRLALINAKFVKVGDKIGTATVATIDKNSVVLSEADEKITIYLFDKRGWEEPKDSI